MDSRNNGLDGVIPRSVLQNAKGFAIFTVAKAGFVFSARAGSGVVIAKLDHGQWTAPSAIGTAGFGFGGQAGAEVTDFLVVLNTRAAIRSFMAAGSLQLGGNLSIALGPLGRNGEAMGSMSSGGKVAAMYSYSKTRGLFGGISIEGSVIVERQDANTQAYNSPVTVKMLLGGAVDPPPWAAGLIKTLENCTGMPGQRGWVHDDFNPSLDQGYAFAGPSPSPQASPSPSTQSRRPSFLKRKKSDKQPFPPAHWEINDGEASHLPEAPRHGYDFDRNPNSVNTRFDNGLERRATFTSPSNLPKSQRSDNTLVTDLDDPFDNVNAVNAAPVTRGHMPHATSLGGSFKYSYSNESSSPASRSPSQSIHGKAQNNDNAFPSAPFSEPQKRHSYIRPGPRLMQSLAPEESIARAVALYNFKAVEDGDLSFNKGDVITIIKKSDSTDDWWTGRLNDKEGIFPANFVELA